MPCCSPTRVFILTALTFLPYRVVSAQIVILISTISFSLSASLFLSLYPDFVPRRSSFHGLLPNLRVRVSRADLWLIYQTPRRTSLSRFPSVLDSIPGRFDLYLYGAAYLTAKRCTQNGCNFNSYESLSTDLCLFTRPIVRAIASRYRPVSIVQLASPAFTQFCFSARDPLDAFQRPLTNTIHFLTVFLTVSTLYLALEAT